MIDDTDAMPTRLTRENLHGIWAALPTPFAADGQLDEDALRENVRRLTVGGVHGIYTTDADGEFYALELDEFEQLVGAFADECGRVGVPSQVGCTWPSTAGVVARLRICAELGVLGAHVGHPFFMPMTRDSMWRFWDDVAAAVPDWFALIHYNSLRCPNYLTGRDYAELAERIPNLVGVKYVKSDFSEFLELVSHAPQLSVFVSEQVLAPFYRYGARGIYSWFANVNPRYLRDWYEELGAGQWSKAEQRQLRLHAFSQASQPLREQGHLHAALNKARTAALPFLVSANRTRAPYLPVPQQDVDAFARTAHEQFPDLVGHLARFPSAE